MATTLQVAAVQEQSATTDGWSSSAKAFILALGLRFFYSLFAAQLSPHLRLDPKLIRSNQLTAELISRDSHPLLYALLGVWERFDTLWYIQISRHGYDSPNSTVFYPLYPALMRVVSFLTHSDLAAAVLISTAASFFLFWGALRLFELDAPPVIALRALLIWCAWPASFAFFAGYPDSLLCALTVWSLYFARSNRWALAGALGLFAGSTKALGCLTALPLLWIAWKQRQRRGISAAALCVTGAALFPGWLMFQHFPTAVQVYRIYWATTTVAPWTTVSDAVGSLLRGDNTLLLLNVGVFAVVGTAALMSRVRFEYKLYAVAAMCLYLTKHTDPLLQSTTRYSLAIFAAWPALAVRLGRRLTLGFVLFIAGALNLLLFRAFLDWGLAV